MAANYWNSSQSRYWTFTPESLAGVRSDLAQRHTSVYAKYPLPDPRLLNIYIQQQTIKLGKRINLRQQALATAQMYLRRFWTRVEFRKTNPYLLITTALYLASKMEETPQHIRLVLGEAQRQWPSEFSVSETSKIGECEFALIATLQSRLILHHPYRALGELQTSMGISGEEASLAHNIINDSFNTDLPLLHPPHLIAVMAIFLAVVLRPAQPVGLHAHSANAYSPSSNGPTMAGSAARDVMANFGFAAQGGGRAGAAKLNKLVDWLAESEVDMDALVSATQEMVSLYEVWEGYSERVCREAVQKLVRDNK
ncbi:hypothetical protein MBLNU230_g1752t1 [Neophaeotheca triangularis]